MPKTFDADVHMGKNSMTLVFDFRIIKTKEKDEFHLTNKISVQQQQQRKNVLPKKKI